MYSKHQNNGDVLCFYLKCVESGFQNWLFIELTLIHALKAQDCYIMSDLISIFYDMPPSWYNSVAEGFLFYDFKKIMVQFDGAITML